jgi:hypothetical protein
LLSSKQDSIGQRSPLTQTSVASGLSAGALARKGLSSGSSPADERGRRSTTQTAGPGRPSRAGHAIQEGAVPPVPLVELLANCVIFSNAAELTAVLNQLCVEGNQRRSEDVAALSPYITNHILRFGDYVLELSPPRTAVNTHLDLSTEANALQLPTKE